MLVIIKILNGDEHNFEVSPDETISSFKKLIEKQLNIPINQQRLMLKGKPLGDTSSLTDLKIEQGTKIHLSVKKDVDTPLNKELREFGRKYFTDVDQFVNIFNKELNNLVDELNLDDIERYNESRWKEEHSEDDEKDGACASSSGK